MRQTKAGRWKAKEGFTLLEMLVVLAIVGLAAAISAPLLRPSHGPLTLAASAHQLCSTLRNARAHAIATNKETDVIVDIEHRRYASSFGPSTALPADADIKLIIADDRRLDAIHGSFAFFPSGASSGGEIHLGNHGKSIAITISWFTGEAVCAY